MMGVLSDQSTASFPETYLKRTENSLAPLLFSVKRSNKPKPEAVQDNIGVIADNDKNKFKIP